MREFAEWLYVGAFAVVVMFVLAAAVWAALYYISDRLIDRHWTANRAARQFDEDGSARIGALVCLATAATTVAAVWLERAWLWQHRLDVFAVALVVAAWFVGVAGQRRYGKRWPIEPVERTWQ